MKKQLTKRFEVKDMKRWQKLANKETKGNLNKWMEKVLNERVELMKKWQTIKCEK